MEVELRVRFENVYTGKFRIIPFLLLVFLLLGFIAYSTSKKLRDESFQQLYTLDRIKAIHNYKLAGYIWPLLFLDSSYKNGLVLLERIENRPALVVYLKENTTDKEAIGLKNELQQVKGVKRVDYVSAEAAYQRYKDQNLNNPSLVALMTPSLFPGQVEVYSSDYLLWDQITQIAKNKPFVNEIVHSQ